MAPSALPVLVMYRSASCTLTFAVCCAALLLAGPLLALAPEAEAQAGGVAPSFVKVVAGNFGGRIVELEKPMALVLAPDGVLFIVEADAHRVVMWKKGAEYGEVVAGGNGPGAGLNQFNQPSGIARGTDGSLYIADTYNHRVMRWKIGAAEGEVVAGGLDADWEARLAYPTDVKIGPAGELFITNHGAHRILKWSPGAKTGVVVAGDGNFDFMSASPRNESLWTPTSLVLEPDGSLIIADTGHGRVMKWKPGAPRGEVVGNSESKQSTTGRLARENRVSPVAVAMASTGEAYFTDAKSSRIMKWNPGTPDPERLAGGPVGSGIDALREPKGFVIAPDGNLLIADSGNGRIIEWKPGAPQGTVVAGRLPDKVRSLHAPTAVMVNEVGQFIIADRDAHRIVYWSPGDSWGLQLPVTNVNGRGLTRPTGVALEPGGLLIADTLGHRILRHDTRGGGSVQVAGSSAQGSTLGELSVPTGIVPGPNGSILIADAGNHRILKWAPEATEGEIIAGGNDGGIALNQLNRPDNFVLDDSGNLIIADSWNHRIVKWKPGEKNGVVIAGGNGEGSGLHQLNSPTGVFLHPNGDLYIADTKNHRVLEWKPGAKEGVIVAGTGKAGSGLHELNAVHAVTMDFAGNLVIADTYNHRILAHSGNQRLVLSPGVPTAVNLRGFDFAPGATVDWGEGVTATDVKVTPTAITAKLTAAPTASPGPRDVVVTNPGVKETATCNGCVAVEAAWYADADGDKFGDPKKIKIAADAPARHVKDGTDCDDTDPTIHPGAAKRENGKDNDCDGKIDEIVKLPPVTTDVAPKTGEPGTKVTLTGKNYAGVTSVHMNGAKVDFTHDAAKETITFTTPTPLRPGSYWIALDGPGGKGDACCFTVPLAPPPKSWDATLTVSGPGALTDKLTIGLNERATDGFDAGLDEDEPRRNDDSFVQIFALEGANPIHEAIKSLRAPGPHQQWWIDTAIRVPQATTLTLAWDPPAFAAFPRDYSVRLFDHGQDASKTGQPQPIDLTLGTHKFEATSGDSFHRFELRIEVELPDLAVSADGPDDLIVGTNAVYDVTIVNHGNLATRSGRIVLTVDGVALKSEDLPSIPPGGQIERKIEYTPTLPGKFDVALEIQHVLPAEIATDNNRATKTLDVAPDPNAATSGNTPAPTPAPGALLALAALALVGGVLRRRR